MSHSLLRRCLLVLVALGITLGVPAVSARPVSWGSLLLEGRNAWTWVGEILMDQNVLEGRASKFSRGESIRSRPQSATPVKHRCGIDPNGQTFCEP